MASYFSISLHLHLKIYNAHRYEFDQEYYEKLGKEVLAATATSSNSNQDNQGFSQGANQGGGDLVDLVSLLQRSIESRLENKRIFGGGHVARLR